MCKGSILNAGTRIIQHTSKSLSSVSYPTRSLQIAIKSGNIQSVEFLLKQGARLDVDSKSFCPMYYVLRAPIAKQAQLLQLLVKYGLNVAERDALEDVDYLQYTVERSIHNLDMDVLGIARILLEAGVPVNSVDRFGMSTFFWAVRSKNVELVKMLIDGGADVNEKIHGVFPLYWAARSNHVDVLEVLLSKGARIDARTDFGQTALHSACLDRRRRTINYLIHKGADVNLEDETGSTPFSFLKPRKYDQFDVPCINAMVKEIAMLNFSGAVSQKNLDLVHAHPAVQAFFYSCTEELSQMSSFKFYGCCSYYSVMEMSRVDPKKLARLTNDKAFVTRFKENLSKFSYYNNDLKRVFYEAVHLRAEMAVIYSRLCLVFKCYFPDVVIRKIAYNLRITDVPLR